ncbi:membrane protein YpdK [Pectobacterium quasiaquaticum]|uniref:Membrane protein YpdK n=1 Tax=Pectobacterium quasiaquaticum TaxID=2774015 RepID=A0A9Q8TTI8_9GAMM|nr:membrane protein YpdK [Pectobacterium aquaticum]URG50122.1 membrane protein YpdK [Pectobacterium quasiaquaticum]URG53918.1 membrane protein YpdK [Pectobacterium quasiaquaticum]
MLAWFLLENKSVKYFFMGISFCLVVWVSAFMLMVE